MFKKGELYLVVHSLLMVSFVVVHRVLLGVWLGQ